MALDAGVNIVDTADIYTAGASEEIIGQALGGKRNRVLLATKVVFRWAPARTTQVCRASI